MVLYSYLRNTTLGRPKNEEERIKGGITIELIGLLNYEQQTKELSRRQYINVLYVVEESLVTRREMAGHPRGYLDFLREFIPEASGNSSI